MAASSPLHIQQSLKNVGFTSNETNVLLLLFQIKKGTLKEVSQKTAISLSGAQFALSSLGRKKLIRNIPGPEEQYEICTKEFLQTWIQEQKKSHDEIYDQAGKDLEGFFEFVQENSWQPTILYYEGEEGIKEIYEDMIANNQTPLFGWTDSSTMYGMIQDDYIPNWVARRQEKGITSYAIMPRNAKNEEYAKKDSRECQLADFDFSGQIRIYDDKAAIMTFSEDKPVGIILQGELFAKLFKSIFDLCWKKQENQK